MNRTFTKKNSGRMFAREALLYPEQPGVDYQRPKTVADCRHLGTPEQPCPFVSCKWHLYLNMTRKGSLRVTNPAVEPEDLPWSCTLRVTEAFPEGLTVPQVAELSGEREPTIRSIVNVTQAQLRHLPILAVALELADE